MDQRCIGVVLAAGASSRMGGPKGLLDVDGVPIIRRHVDQLTRHCARVRVVLGCKAEPHAAALNGTVAEVVLNLDWARTGPAASLAAALSGLPATATVLIAPVDTPPAPDAVILALLAAPWPAVPVYRGRLGHPVHAQVGPLAEALRDGTLRDATRGATAVSVDWPEVDTNLNTPSEWAAWRRRRHHQPGPHKG
jgi:molybdenum cofactor cytidylyltransferase